MLARSLFITVRPYTVTTITNCNGEYYRPLQTGGDRPLPDLCESTIKYTAKSMDVLFICFDICIVPAFSLYMARQSIILRAEKCRSINLAK